MSPGELLRRGRYAFRGHAGGLSCQIIFEFSHNKESRNYLEHCLDIAIWLLCYVFLRSLIELCYKQKASLHYRLFFAGWHVDVQVQMGLMLFILTVPESERGKTSGLLGGYCWHIEDKTIVTSTFIIGNHLFSCIVDSFLHSS